MANFKAWVEKSPRTGNYTIRYRDGKTKLANGRWKVLSDITVDKTQRLLVDGKWKTAKTIAEDRARQIELKNLSNLLGNCDPAEPIEPLIEKFLNNCRNSNLSPTTIDNYEFSLKRDFLLYGNFKTLGDLTPEKILEWRDEMYTRVGTTTIRGRMVTAHTFCVWLQETGHIKLLPFRKKMYPKEKKGGPKYYSLDNWMGVDEAAKVKPNARLAFNLAFNAGLREVELVGNEYRQGIQWDDLTWHKDGTVDLTIREEVGKGATAGVIRLDPGTVALLGSRGKTGSIITMSRRSLWNFFLKCRKKAGNDKLTIHRMRHTFVKNILELGDGDLATAQEAARHADIKTTQIYAHHEKSHVTKVLERTYERRIQEEAIRRSNSALQGTLEEVNSGQMPGNITELPVINDMKGSKMEGNPPSKAL